MVRLLLSALIAALPAGTFATPTRLIPPTEIVSLCDDFDIDAIDSSNFEEEVVDIVVIGAGFSGLAASKTIEEIQSSDDCSVNISYVTLEAKPDAGGVARGFNPSSYDPDLPNVLLEDGPNWIGGDNLNPIFEMAKTYGVKVFPQDFLSTLMYNTSDIIDGAMQIVPRRSQMDADGNVVKKGWLRAWNEYARRAGPCLNEAGLLGAGAITSDSSPPPFPASVRETYPYCGPAFGQGPGKSWPIGSEPDDLDEFATWLETDYFDGGSPDLNSPLLYPVGTYYEGNTWDKTLYNPYYTEYFAKDRLGLRRIARKEASSLEQPIHFNEEVCYVDYDEEGASVYTSANKIYHTRKVISSMNPSLYLSRDIFSDPILETSDDLPFIQGNYTKVFYIFENDWWSRGDSYEFYHLLQPTDINDRTANRYGWFQNFNVKYAPADFARYYPDLTSATDLTNVKNKIWPGSNVLMLLLTTEEVRQAGGSISKAKALSYLSQFKKDGNFPDYKKPTHIYIPDYSNDPHTGDLLVGPKATTTPENYDTFITSGQPTIHLTGSPICKLYAGWMHGAHYAGIKVAQETINDLGEDNCSVDVNETCDDFSNTLSGVADRFNAHLIADDEM